MKVNVKSLYCLWMVVLCIYLLLWMCYLWDKAPVSPRVIELLLWIIVVFGTFLLIVYGDKKTITSVSGVLLLLLLFWGMTIIWNSMSIYNTIYSMIHQFFWVVCFFVFKDCCGQKKYRHFIFCSIVVLALCCAVLSLVWMLTAETLFTASINSLYYALLAVPVFFWPKNKRMFRIIHIVLCTILVILSGKRTAMLVLSFGVFVPYLFEAFRGTNKKKGKILLGVFGLILLFIYSYEYLERSYDLVLFDRFSDIVEDGGAGRLDIYKSVSEAYQSSSFAKKIIGHGFNAVFQTGAASTSAHNDFLEVLYDFGIIGCILYAIFFLLVIWRVFYLMKIKSEYFTTYFSTVIIMCIMSTTSHLVLYPTYYSLLLFFVATGFSVEKERLNENLTY